MSQINEGVHVDISCWVMEQKEGTEIERSENRRQGGVSETDEIEDVNVKDSRTRAGVGKESVAKRGKAGREWSGR